MPQNTDRTQPLDFTGCAVPSHTREALNRVWLQNLPPGGFLQAVFDGDLVRAVINADLANRKCLADVALFVHSTLPPEFVNEWRKK